MRNHVINEITRIALYDQRIMLVTADLGYSVVEHFEEKFPNRFINVGIAEQNMTAVAAGLALEGNMVFTYSIGNFPTLRCIEQIRNDVCYHDANVKILAVGGGFAYGDLGMTHHATEDIAMMRALPNMRVYVPADAIEAVACLKDAVSFDGPAYIRMARGREEDIHAETDNLNIKSLISVKANHDCPDVSVIASGTILSEAIKIKDTLETSGISVNVFSAPRVKPIDINGICCIAKNSRIIVSMEEHNIIGGLGGAIAEIISGLDKNRAVLVRVGLNDVYTSVVGDQNFLRDYYGMSSEKVSNIVTARLEELL